MNHYNPVSIEVTQIAKIKVSYYHLKQISARTFPQKWLKWKYIHKEEGFLCYFRKCLAGYIN
jgi:hypothetical protein